MVPLDPLWDGGYLATDNLKQIADAGQYPWCKMASKIFQRTLRLVKELNRNPINGIGTVSPPDLLAAAVAIDPDIAVMQENYVMLETRGEYTRGMTVLDRRVYYRIENQPDRSKVKIALSAHQEKYSALILETWLHT